MPLKCVEDGTARRCAAIARSTGNPCLNPAVTGVKNCRYHGGHKKVRRGHKHWNYQGAGQTLPERQARHEMAVFFHQTENLMAKLGMLASGATRTRGRKPKT